MSVVPEPTLLETLSNSLKNQPGSHSFVVQVLRSSPRRSYALFPYASNLATKVWQEEVLVLLSDAVPSSPTISPSSVDASDLTVPLVGVEASIYTIPSTSTSLLYISKVDTTGLSSSSPNPTRTIVSAFVEHHLRYPPHQTRRLRIHVFARAQGQYLFPGSIENTGKRVLDDKGLMRWWKATFSQAAIAVASPTLQLFCIIPGLSQSESLLYVPSTPSSAALPWTYSHSYSQVGSPLHPSSVLPADVPLPDHIPSFPDDPKARFITSLTSSSIPPAGSEDDYDETLHSLYARSFNSGATGAAAHALANLEKDRAIERSRLVDGIPGGVDEYWERLAFRQECCSGALVGFFVVVNDRPDPLENKSLVEDISEGTGKRKSALQKDSSPRPVQLSVDHNVFTRLWSQFHNADYATPAISRLAVLAAKWEHDVHALVLSEGWAGKKLPTTTINEHEEGFAEDDKRTQREGLYQLEIRRKTVVNNPPLERASESKRLGDADEPKKVNVMVPRKKKKL